jgi:DNA invertase Pin-like site-specific DNA recombinase
MKTAVIFARVSSVTDRQNTDRQIVDLKKYADFAGLNVEKVFSEKISGGKRNDERPLLMECLEYCQTGKTDMLLVSELSRLGRNSFEVLATVKLLIDAKINLYLQKEQFLLLDDDGNPSLFAPVMLATLATCAQMERENIKFRLNSGRQNYIANGGRLGRNKGSVKTIEAKRDEYKQVIALLKKGTSIRNVAKIAGVGVSTVQRIKKEFEI